MPIKAFFFLLKNPNYGEVDAFRSLIFEPSIQTKQKSDTISNGTENEVKELIKERR